ncbi:MAG: DUF3617 family protein [Candidatus Omnitrophota bacterium]|nr:DUF3617 family protein [Candidatus Omnitrophota bacterium]MDZ4242838.1 DUF3617 family protein [Candidatus Omnitrophota bacterium]
MKKLILAMAVVAVGSLVFAAGLRAEGVREGKWSMTMVTTMGGMNQEATEAMESMENMSPDEKAMMEKMMGGMKLQAAGSAVGMTTTTTQCITNDNPVPDADATEDCQTTHTMDGNTVKFESVCKDSTSTGEITYQEDSMNGWIKSHQTVDGNETDVTIEISGQYVGPCGG